MANKRSPSSSVNAFLFLTRSSPVPAYSSMIRSLRISSLGLREQATHLSETFKHNETERYCNLSYIRVEHRNYLHDLLTIHSLCPVWRSKELREDATRINISDKHISSWAGNQSQLSIQTYITKHPASFIAVNTGHEWFSETFMFMEQLIHRFSQEMPIKICRKSESLILNIFIYMEYKSLYRKVLKQLTSVHFSVTLHVS